jgi:uncharacterized membrane protein
MKGPKLLSQIVLACALGAGLAACGSSGSSGSSSTPSTSAPATSAPATSASAATGSAAAEKVIAANWAAFFNAKTPVAKRVSLLQDGSEFASIIQAQAGSSLAAGATAKVTNATLVSSTEAKVTYSILEGGQAALANQTGEAVYQDGTWKVGVASFCGLLTLENSGSTSSLPAACKTAG